MAELTIVHLDRGSIGPDVDLRKPGCAHHWISYDVTPKDEVIPRLASADVAIVNKIELDQATLDQLPRLKMIAISATGFDKIDIETCRKKGIVVSNIRGYAKHSVPEHAFALMLALRRGLKGYTSDLQQGLWQAAIREEIYSTWRLPPPVPQPSGPRRWPCHCGACGHAQPRGHPRQGLPGGRATSCDAAPQQRGQAQVLGRMDVSRANLWQHRTRLT